MTNEIYKITKVGSKYCFATKAHGVRKQGTKMEAFANVMYYQRIEANLPAPAPSAEAPTWEQRFEAKRVKRDVKDITINFGGNTMTTQIAQLKAEIETEAKWAVRHEDMGRTAMAITSRVRLDNMIQRLRRLEKDAA